MDPQGGSNALVEALSADLRARMQADAPVVAYAWVRTVQTEEGPRRVMFAKLFQHHRSQIVEAIGADSDSAYAALLERCVAWTPESGSGTDPIEAGA